MAEDLKRLTAAELERLGHAAAKSGERGQVRACMRELNLRGSPAAKRAFERLRLLVLEAPPRSSNKSSAVPASRRRASESRSPGSARAAGPTREWIEKVARIAAQFKPDHEGECSVYVVLFNRDGEYGLYVGQTAEDVHARFRLHKDNYKAGRGIVRDYGSRVLAEVAAHLRGNLSRSQAEFVEEQLAGKLARAGFVVEGGH